MKKLLLASSLVIVTVTMLLFACQQKTGSKTVKEEVKMEEAKPEMDADEGKVVNHGGPDQAKLDSLKAAKTKAKKMKKNGGN